MCTNTERLLHDLSAFVTLLACEMGGHSYDLMPSTCSLCTQYSEECAPTGVHDAFRQVMVFDHVGDSQVFNDNTPIAFSVRLSRLEMVVTPLTLNLEMGFRHVFRSFTVSMTPFLTSAHLALFTPECALRYAIETGILNSVTLRVRQERFQANIYPNVRMFTVSWFVLSTWLSLAHDQRVPVAIGTQNQMHRLRCSLERTMHLDLERLADLSRHDQMFLVFVQVTIFAVLPELNGVPTIRLFEAREPDTGNIVLFRGQKTFE